jgi:hypothetical protein
MDHFRAAKDISFHFLQTIPQLVAAKKTYCLLDAQTILCEWMKLGLVSEKDQTFIYYLEMSMYEF